jgi:hypothetical protein
MVQLLIGMRLRFPANGTSATVNRRFLHLLILLVNPLTPSSIHDSLLKNTELFLHWPLLNDFPAEYKDIINILCEFRLNRSAITSPGGQKSKVASAIDEAFYGKNPPWIEKNFSTQIVVDGTSTDSPTHNVDCYRNGVAVEIEWNNKDPFF